MIRNFCFLTLIVFLAGCSSKAPVEKVLDEEGRTIEEFEINPETQQREGLYKRFNEDGSLAEEAIFKAGKLTGERKLYYDNGQLQSVETRVEDQFEGPYKDYFDDGSLQSEGVYSNNAMNGVWKYYYVTGGLKEEVNFKDNYEDGPFKSYHPNGKLESEGTFKVGVNEFGESNETGDKEHGELKLYDTNGELLKIMDCVYGICRTTWSKDETENNDEK